jgi:simple sugar transport system ATP-binding protein
MQAQNPAIELRGLTKTFGPVVANDRINLAVRQGEILALLGENGSGKTTLMNMLSGIYRPDSGEIFVQGRPVDIRAPGDAIALGIGMIHQHFKLVDVLTAMENIVLGTRDDHQATRRALEQRIREISRRFGLDVTPEKKIYNMAVGEKQTVEILKVLYRGARILILDEPTAVLTPQEADRLFDILRHMKADGCAVIIITHKLGEVMAIADRITILRKGASVATVEKAATTVRELTELMVGRPLDLAIHRPPVDDPKRLLDVFSLTVLNAERVPALRDVTFSLRGGEVLGVAGVAGSGQRELCETIAGLMDKEEGAILFHGKNIEGKTPRQIIEMGISMSFIPEDRLGMGLVGAMGIVDNLLLKDYQKGRGPFVRRAPARARAKEMIARLGIVTPDTRTPVRRLSGGNVQKVLLGREIASGPELLITAYPVRGLDIHSSYTIYDLINEQKRKGVGVLFIGEDLDVLLELCDRILVLCGGEVTGIVRPQETTKAQLGLMMTGSLRQETGVGA